ncbi:S1C family serine protease [Inmirania thermothiophila]|uniref:Serine protease DegS/serine protease DegQ n=1 Tax=Inmirania thermothiophila TaxID=1750597 RepID=A0A3N1XU12_9GAMM|nr:Do family serine endopeptidase [Inmirania thermothiophila]ROR29661.1 serine protease DegS/serine protease DegQ [Inmirania thermothiophila]
MGTRKWIPPGLRLAVLFAAAAAVVLALRPDLLPQREVRITRSAPPQAAAPAPASYADAVARAAPAVVNVYTARVVTQRPSPLAEDPVLRFFFGDELERMPRRRVQNSLGSGVIVSPQGYILTNNHVIEGADEIQVALADGRTAEARVVGTDPDTDLAVLRVDLERLPAIVLGDSGHLRVGDVVLAIGNPFGVGQTVTQGIVSATGRKRLGLNTFENFIQTDAAINPGNSGGALVDARGTLVGINTAIFSRSGGSQGIGFAIPVDLAAEVLEQIIRHGRVVRGWLGVEIQELTPALAESLGAEPGRGVLVAGVLRGGPADRGGIEPGDVLLAIDGAPLATPDDLLERIARRRPGETVRVEILRQGRRLALEAPVGQRPARLPGR